MHDVRRGIDMRRPGGTCYERASRRTSAFGGYSSLNVWATLRGKHVKVLNVTLIGDAVGIISFRRGDWENELRAMGREAGVAVN